MNKEIINQTIQHLKKISSSKETLELIENLTIEYNSIKPINAPIESDALFFMKIKGVEGYENSAILMVAFARWYFM